MSFSSPLLCLLHLEETRCLHERSFCIYNYNNKFAFFKVALSERKEFYGKAKGVWVVEFVLTQMVSILRKEFWWDFLPG